MTSSFIPVFTKYMREKTRGEVWDFANRLFWTLAFLVAIITVMGMVFSPAVIHTFTSSQGTSVSYDAGHHPEPHYFPIFVFCFACRAGDGHFELLQHVRRCRRPHPYS